MRPFSRVLLLLTVLTFIFNGSAQQIPATSVPNLIRYGGVLKDAQDSAISSRTVGITFLIYKQQDGGAPIWMETQNVTLDATAHYSVVLGSTTATGLPDDLFSQQEQRWLGVQVQGQPEQPRVLLVSVPYAIKAAEADRLAGHNASEYVTIEALQNAVQQQLQATGVAAAVSATSNSKGANAGLAPVVTNPATNFVDTTTNQVVLVQQNGTGVALKATAGGNSAITAATTSGSVPAISGTSSSTTGTGVSGSASSSSGVTYGVNGQSSSTAGVGVRGLATATTGSTIGVLGSSSSTSGSGVFATATASSGATMGLKAQVSSASGTAAVIQNTASGKLISGRTGSGTGTEKFAVDGSGNITASGAITGTGNVSGRQLISKVAIGTPPLQVASTTVVPNLNASLLGGNPASAFASATGSGSYIHNVTTPQTANFNISGNGTVGGTLTGGRFVGDGSGLTGVVATATMNPMAIALKRWYPAIQTGNTFVVGNSPWGMAFDGANIWATSLDNATVTKLRVADGANLGTFNVGTNPTGVAFDGANIWGSEQRRQHSHEVAGCRRHHPRDVQCGIQSAWHGI